MKRFYWPCLAGVVLFIGFADSHTDETPVILGILLLLAAFLGLINPARFIATGLVTGSVVFLTETLVTYGFLRAPYASGPGLPWPALIAFIPAFLGAGGGAGIRRLVTRSLSA